MIEYDFKIPEEVHVFLNEYDKEFGFLVIDSKINGRACGGIRMASDLTLDELKHSARQKTLKYGFLGIGIGGAKSGIIGNPETEIDEKTKLLKMFANSILTFIRDNTYLPGKDIGLKSLDYETILNELGLGSVQNTKSEDRSGESTALTILECMRISCEYAGFSFKDARVGIEGFGRVGSALAALLDSANVKIVAVSTSKGTILNPKGINITRLIELKKQLGGYCVREYKEGDFLDNTDLTAIPINIYAPCSRLYSVNEKNIKNFSAKIICGGSNLQVKPDLESIIFEKGIIYIPSFVASCGQVLWSTIQRYGLEYKYFKKVVETNFHSRLYQLFRKSNYLKRSLMEIASEFALNRFRSMKTEASLNTLKGNVLLLGKKLDEKKLLPTFIRHQYGKNQMKYYFKDK
jgi:glutamate dehydrogenase/leucine dehydrogenase